MRGRKKENERVGHREKETEIEKERERETEKAITRPKFIFPVI